MISSKSRYARTSRFNASSEGEVIFRGIRAREIETATGVIEHEVQAGDRLDQLARHYYNNDRLWWRIVDANPEFFYGQSFLPPKDASQASAGAAEPVHSPGVILCKEMEGSVILIPRMSGG
jgi:nucleoid-associated protein YgaU